MFSLALFRVSLKKSSISLAVRCPKNGRKGIPRLKVIYSYLPEGSRSLGPAVLVDEVLAHAGDVFPIHSHRNHRKILRTITVLLCSANPIL